MTQVLSDFIRALRASDVRVSTAESIDAAATIDAIGFADRALVKESLSQVLAKTIDDKARFTACFDRFFFAENMAGIDDLSDQETEDSAIPVGLPAADAVGDDGSLGVAGSDNRAEMQLAVANAARDVEVANIRLFTQRGMYMRRILERLGIDALEHAMREAQDPDRAAELRQRRAQLIEEVRDQVDRQLLLYTQNAWPELREEILKKTPLSSIEMRDFKFMQALVYKLAKRLVALHSRRRKIARRGHLDVRHTIRRNIEYDGLLFQTVWKRKKIERPKVIAVCDVSGSVATAARFLLLFLYSVTAVIPKVRAFAFSNQLGEVTEYFETLTAADAIAKTLERFAWGSTDYGRAFTDLESLIIDEVDHRTTVLVLGDGRSNFGDPGVSSLRKIHARARRTLWLNPEPRSLWNTGDSEIRRMGSACDRVDTCRSMQDLERLISELMRTAI